MSFTIKLINEAIKPDGKEEMPPTIRPESGFLLTYESRPVEIKAIRYNGINLDTIFELIDKRWFHFQGRDLYVESHQGAVKVNPGDYIIMEFDNRGAYPCDAVHFNKKYVRKDV